MTMSKLIFNMASPFTVELYENVPPHVTNILSSGKLTLPSLYSEGGIIVLRSKSRTFSLKRFKFYMKMKILVKCAKMEIIKFSILNQGPTITFKLLF